MSSKHARLLLIPLLAVAAFLAYPQVDLEYRAWKFRRANPVLPGTNAVSQVDVKQDLQGQWNATVHYFYTGRPASAQLYVEQAVMSPTCMTPPLSTQFLLGTAAQRGEQVITVPVKSPWGNCDRTTQGVSAQIRFGHKDVIAARTQPVEIKWADPAAVREREASKPEALMARAIPMIDYPEGDELQTAKGLLEKVIAQDPRFDRAYVELARVAMKQNWGPVGLGRAEGLIGSALQIRPDSVDANVLLAYVYGYQGKFAAAEALLVAASKTDTKNLWLWTTWGEVLQLQGRNDEAIAKYRDSLNHPPTRDTNDRARYLAYSQLMPLLESRKDLDGVEALHKQRTADYPKVGCYAVGYARFLVVSRGDATGAIQLARGLPEGSCDGMNSRDVLGVSYYLNWAAGKDPERAEALRQARVFLPAGPSMFYHLATSEKTLPAAQKLVAAGEQLGVRDASDFDALSYALRHRNHAMAARLLRLGARADALVGPEKMPVALLPVLSGDVEGIRLMQRARVDYTTLRIQGSTAVDLARRTGDAKLLQLLDPKAGSL